MVAELNISFYYILLLLQIQIINPDMELNKQQSNFEQLLDSIYQTHCVLQENTQRIINQNLTLVKYTTADKNDQLFVSKYLLELPDKKVLENFIKKELEERI